MTLLEENKNQGCTSQEYLINAWQPVGYIFYQHIKIYYFLKVKIFHSFKNNNS